MTDGPPKSCEVSVASELPKRLELSGKLSKWALPPAANKSEAAAEESSLNFGVVLLANSPVDAPTTCLC